MATILDVIVQPLYDTNWIPAAGVQQILFFTQPIGQGVSAFAAASTKTYADTNMTTAGSLPAGYNFILAGFRLLPDFAMTVADATLALNGAVFVFTVSSKDYLTVPARTIPAGAGVYGGGATAGPMTTWGMPQIQNAYKVGSQPMELAQSQNFGVALRWPGGGQQVTTTLAGRTTGGAVGLPITVVLDGVLKRLPQ
jgi:hypothetical protein